MEQDRRIICYRHAKSKQLLMIWKVWAPCDFMIAGSAAWICVIIATHTNTITAVSFYNTKRLPRISHIKIPK